MSSPQPQRARLARRPRARHRTRGQSLVEFALALPVLLIVLLFAIDFGRAFYSWVILQNASRLGANFAALNPEGWEGAGNATLKAQYEALVTKDWGVLECDTPPDPAFTVSGEYESFTPRVNVLYSFLDGDIQPYVSAGIGWSFIDTNVPQGPPQTGCWWDPWWGYICTTYQNTRDMDEFAYQAGVGVRWDVTSGLTLRLGYEKQWIDLGEADSAPGFDVLRLGVAYRY